jgi:hypothetical protein
MSSYAQPTDKKMTILAYCHSKNHSDKVKKDLKVPKKYHYDTNDIHGSHANDIKIDLSRRNYNVDALQNIYKKTYDCIYMINCPSGVYISNNKLNRILFMNMYHILKPGGLLITRFSDTAILEIFSLDENYSLNNYIVDENPYATVKELEEHNQNEFESYMNILKRLRINLKEQLIKQKLPFTLLDESENQKYINDNYEQFSSVSEYLIFQKTTVGVKRDTCDRLVYWTQFENTNICWFISILVTLFYSQFSRELLLGKKDKWKTYLSKKDFKNLKDYGEEYNFQHVDEFLDDWDNIRRNQGLDLIATVKRLFKVQLLNVFKHVLDFKYIETDNPESDHTFFKKYNTIYVLKLLNIINEKQFFLNDFSNGYYSKYYIKSFVEFLNVSCLMLRVYNIQNEYIACYDICNDVIMNENKEDYIYHNKAYIDQKLATTPDILIVNLSDNYDIYTELLNEGMDYYILDAENSHNVLTYNDAIVFNKTKYNLDAIILQNYNDNDVPHIIAGIQCRDTKYIYNGTDKYEHQSRRVKHEIACPLTLYDWNQLSTDEFCLKYGKCGITKANPRNQCFSFGQGNRLLIYVKESESMQSVQMDDTSKHYVSFNSYLDKITQKNTVDSPEFNNGKRARSMSYSNSSSQGQNEQKKQRDYSRN